MPKCWVQWGKTLKTWISVHKTLELCRLESTGSLRAHIPALSEIGARNLSVAEGSKKSWILQVLSEPLLHQEEDIWSPRGLWSHSLWTWTWLMYRRWSAVQGSLEMPFQWAEVYSLYGSWEAGGWWAVSCKNRSTLKKDPTAGVLTSESVNLNESSNPILFSQALKATMSLISNANKHALTM